MVDVFQDNELHGGDAPRIPKNATCRGVAESVAVVYRAKGWRATIFSRGSRDPPRITAVSLNGVSGRSTVVIL